MIKTIICHCVHMWRVLAKPVTSLSGTSLRIEGYCMCRYQPSKTKTVLHKLLLSLKESIQQLYKSKKMACFSFKDEHGIHALNLKKSWFGLYIDK